MGILDGTKHMYVVLKSSNKNKDNDKDVTNTVVKLVDGKELAT